MSLSLGSDSLHAASVYCRQVATNAAYIPELLQFSFNRAK